MTYTPKHTNEEYLAWIDSELERYTKLLENVPRAESKQSWHYEASLLANRDVLVRHDGVSKEVPTIGWDGVSKVYCMACSFYLSGHVTMFPCPTYLDIAQRLDEVM